MMIGYSFEYCSAYGLPGYDAWKTREPDYYEDCGPYDDDAEDYEREREDELDEQASDALEWSEYMAEVVLGLTPGEWFEIEWARGDLESADA